MPCSFLEGKRILSCRSRGAVYIPSIFELGEYCKQDNHKKCPFLRLSAENVKRTVAVESNDVKMNFP